MIKAGALVPWVLLGAAVIGVVATGRGPATALPEISDVEPAVTGSSAPRPGDARPAASFAPAPSVAAMTPLERRDFRIHIGHEQCEEGAARINELAGREKFAPDTKTISELSICLRIGNVAWYKCILRATSKEEARTCNVRFLSLDHRPP